MIDFYLSTEIAHCHHSIFLAFHVLPTMPSNAAENVVKIMMMSLKLVIKLCIKICCHVVPLIAATQENIQIKLHRCQLHVICIIGCRGEDSRTKEVLNRNSSNTKKPEILNDSRLSVLSSPYGNRTRVTRMKIWCPNP
jgi:hypothetical protein